MVDFPNTSEIKCKGREGVKHLLTKEQFERDKNNFVNTSEYSLNTKKELALAYIKEAERTLKEECVNCEVFSFKVV